MKFKFKSCPAKPTIKKRNLTKKRIESILNDELLSLVKHFETHGWQLNKSYIIEDICYNLLGFHVSEAISYLASQNGIDTEISNEGTFLKSQEPYHPVYYDTYKDKFIIVNNPDDKRYCFKYTEANGYLDLGKL